LVCGDEVAESQGGHEAKTKGDLKGSGVTLAHYGRAVTSVTMQVCDVSAGHTNMCVCAGWSGYIGADLRARHAYPLLNPQNAVLDSHNPA
jgi:hypothetical protein